MKTKKTAEKTAMRYEKPMLRVIELAADELLAGNCKNRTGSSGNATGNHPCLWANCKLLGS
jgi:hypothetical protein